MSSFENPKLNESLWSMSVARTSSARDSESRVASSSPAKPAPRITTCFTGETITRETSAAFRRRDLKRPSVARAELRQLEPDEARGAGAFRTQHDVSDPQPSRRLEARVVHVRESALSPAAAQRVRVSDIAAPDTCAGQSPGEDQAGARPPVGSERQDVAVQQGVGRPGRQRKPRASRRSGE